MKFILKVTFILLCISCKQKVPVIEFSDESGSGVDLNVWGDSTYLYHSSNTYTVAKPDTFQFNDGVQDIVSIQQLKYRQDTTVKLKDRSYDFEADSSNIWIKRGAFFSSKTVPVKYMRVDTIWDPDDFSNFLIDTAKEELISTAHVLELSKPSIKKYAAEIELRAINQGVLVQNKYYRCIGESGEDYFNHQQEVLDRIEKYYAVVLIYDLNKANISIRYPLLFIQNEELIKR